MSRAWHWTALEETWPPAAQTRSRELRRRGDTAGAAASGAKPSPWLEEPWPLCSYEAAALAA